MKTFNTAGPVKPNNHYSISPLARWDTEKICRLIEAERYLCIGKIKFL